jgi:dTDP-4-dehydrorhamnose reductase
MKIVVIGSTGMIGSAIKRFQSSDDIYFLETHQTFDITKRGQMEIVLREKQPDVVINTAVFLGVDPCADDPKKAYSVNANGVKDLAELCYLLDICLVHISSNAIFDGRKGDFYTEHDHPNPINTYGKTKYIGDQAVMEKCEKYYIFRFPILFGTRENKGNIFIEKMYDLANSGKACIKVADDVTSSPSFSDDLAREILRLIKTDLAYGVYHLKNEGCASLFDFASEFFKQFASNVKIERAKAADFIAVEKENKPLNTSIKSVKIDHLRDWREAMTDYIVQFKRKEVFHN